jgi:hypothetical protein
MAVWHQDLAATYDVLDRIVEREVSAMTRPDGSLTREHPLTGALQLYFYNLSTRISYLKGDILYTLEGEMQSGRTAGKLTDQEAVRGCDLLVRIGSDTQNLRQWRQEILRYTHRSADSTAKLYITPEELGILDRYNLVPTDEATGMPLFDDEVLHVADSASPMMLFTHINRSRKEKWKEAEDAYAERCKPWYVRAAKKVGNAAQAVKKGLFS